jgi:hypothetical protein
VKNNRLITCFVNGKWRKYLVIDTGNPHRSIPNELSAGKHEEGGLELFRNDPPFSPAAWNAFVGNFPDMETVMNFIHCLRAGHIRVEDINDNQGVPQDGVEDERPGNAVHVGRCLRQ